MSLDSVELLVSSKFKMRIFVSDIFISKTKTIMKTFILAALFFLMSLAAIKAQSLDCKKFREGSFKMQTNGFVSFIERKGDMQSETTPSRPGTYYFKVNWLDDCTYTLRPTKKTLKKLFKSPPENALLTIRITEVKENSYIQTSTASFLDKPLTNEVFMNP
jgi:hypothetical protein